ncbi:dihydrodipicolinate synthase family protein [Mycobacterium mantenii]|uniref:dihydrodipicolinate synthase family protein n=1 Tax=Mycobacterium mantenii TaxID=560555 RepID=UPI0021F37A32|nr:dihydrodipicolinate synthase family protein [Mycobacterium mantenii]
MVGIVPTPATSDAGSWRADNTVNTAEAEKMIEEVIGAGIEFVMSTGTFGECASLTHDEWLTFTTCIAKVIRGRVPFFAGVTTLNTRDTISRGREAIHAGADGLFVGRPMWLPLDDDAIVRFYGDLTEALPGVPFVVYDNPAAFKGKISVEAYRKLADLPQIVATKHAGGPTLQRDIEAVGDKVAVLPLDSDWYAAAKQSPDLATACWSGNVACAPSPLAALSRAVLSRDWNAGMPRQSNPLTWPPPAGRATWPVPLHHWRHSPGPCSHGTGTRQQRSPRRSTGRWRRNSVAICRASWTTASRWGGHDSAPQG